MTAQRERSAIDDLTQIDKVLLLEERKGHRDTSAANGVARFVGERVMRLLVAAGAQRARLQELDGLLVDYAELGPSERARRVAAARAVVGELLAQPPEIRPVAAPVVPPASASPKSTAREPAPRADAPRPKPSVRAGSFDDSVRILPGVGEGRAKQLELLGVRTVGDLVRLYPRRHVDYSDVQKIGSSLFGHLTTIQGVVRSVDSVRTPTGKELVDVVVADETGQIHATWFNPWVKRQLAVGTLVSLSGRVEQRRGNLCLSNPEWETLDRESLNTGRLTPVYPLVKGLYQKSLRPLARHALDATRHLVRDPLPEELRRSEGLIDLAHAIEWAHFPDGPTPDAARRNLDLAQQRVAFDEFLTLQLGLVRRKQEWRAQPGNAIRVDRDALKLFGESLPYELTKAQRRTLTEIMRDLEAQTPMTRLLQGDVGSGKTVVAAAAAFISIRDGYQAALMAPTEILAEQHARGLRGVFDALPVDIRPSIALLTGSVGGAERKAIYDGVADGSIDFVIGTHALIQGGLSFHRLGFAVVDEQHRFGVQQRALLRGKGASPDVLIMTATPIPRTLALTLHGDLDVSTLDELPPGRQPIQTWWITDRQRAHAWRFVREQVAQGRQAFVVFPLVEESEVVEARAAVAEHERLSKEVFPDLRLGLLHGRMKGAEKDAVMLAFRDGAIDVLVATSVVEVGIDVPNATVMVIDGADRFGLSQLHQFRGRVGRGAEQSFCILVSGDASQDGRARLQALVDSQDGFHLAQIDLELRGPGDFIGTRQSGLPELQLAAFADVRDLERARAAAERILDEDPDLSSERYAELRRQFDRFWATAVTDVS